MPIWKHEKYLNLLRFYYLVNRIWREAHWHNYIHSLPIPADVKARSFTRIFPPGTGEDLQPAIWYEGQLIYFKSEAFFGPVRPSHMAFS